MSLIQNLTMADMLEQAAAMAETEIKNSGYTVRTPWAYGRPITSGDISTQIKVEYDDGHTRLEPAEIIGVVYLTGNLPFRPFPGPTNKLTAFSVKTEETGRDAYIKMFDLCQTLSGNIRKVLEDHAAVLMTDLQLEVKMKSDNDEYRVRVNDLMHRRNRWYRKDPDTGGFTEMPIPTAELPKCLTAAKERYQDILTERKVQRLDTLIAEANGTQPTYKQRQKAARDSKS